MNYSAGIYKGEGRSRWAVHCAASNTWILPTGAGRAAAEKMAKHLNDTMPRERDVRSPLAKFNVYYLNTRTIIEARHEGEAESIAAQRWNTTTKAVKAFRIPA